MMTRHQITRLILCLLLLLGHQVKASDLPYYNYQNTPNWYNFNRLGITQIVQTEALAWNGNPGTLRVTFRILDKNGANYIQGDGDFQVNASGQITNTSGPSWNFDPRWNDANLAPYTLTVHSATRMGFGPHTGPVTVGGDKVLTMTNIGNATNPNRAIEQFFSNATLIVGPSVPDCPPRTGVKFNLDYTIGGTGEYLIQLFIDGEFAGYATGGSYDGLGGPPLEKQTLWGPMNLPGEFAWQVKANGEVVGSGTVGCGDEIPLSTINVFFDYLIKPPPPTEPDPEEKPDPDKPQPTPENPKPNPDGMQPGQAPSTTGPGAPGLPVGDPGHDMYRAFVAGLGTMNSGDFAGAPFTSGLADYESEMNKRGRLDDIEGKLTEIEAQQGVVQAGLMGAAGAADSAMTDILSPGFISGIGKTQVWDYASFTLPTGQSVVLKLNMATFLPIINQIRQILLLFVYIWFIWAAGKEIVDAL